MERVTNLPLEATQIQYAGFWKRFLASLLDGFILSAAVGICFIILMIGSGALPPSHNGNQAFATVGLLAFYAIAIFGDWLYSALMQCSKYQATIGKLALGLRVTDMEGRRISFGRATGRYFASWLSEIILFIGYIMIAFTPKKQGVHDMIAGTLVLSKQSAVPTQVAGNALAAS